MKNEYFQTPIVRGEVLDNNEIKSVIMEIKFGKDLLKMRFAFNKQTEKGFIRHCAFYENYQDEWKRTIKDITFEKLNYEPKFKSLGDICQSP